MAAEKPTQGELFTQGERQENQPPAHDFLKRYGPTRQDSKGKHFHKISVPEADQQEILSLFSGGMKGPEIGRRLGHSTYMVRRVLRWHGVAWSDGPKPRYICNDRYFASIDTEAKAYWLGFLAADGHIGSEKDFISFALMAADKAHVETFRDTLNATNPVRVWKGARSTHKQCWLSGIRITSTPMVNDLARWGVVRHKTLRLTPTILPPDLTRHYLRGLLDGDGGIHFSNKAASVYMAGTKAVLQAFADHVAANVYRHRTRPRFVKNKLYDLCFSGIHKAAAVCRHFYENSTVALPRKLCKATAMIEAESQKQRRFDYRDVTLDQLLELRQSLGEWGKVAEHLGMNRNNLSVRLHRMLGMSWRTYLASKRGKTP